MKKIVCLLLCLLSVAGWENAGEGNLATFKVIFHADLTGKR